MKSSGQRVKRTPSLIAHSREEYLLASIQTAGRARIEQGGRAAVLEPGSMAFYDSTEPYILHMDEAFEQIVVQLPLREILTAGALSRTDAATAVALGGNGAAGVVAGFIRALSVAQQHDPIGAGVMSGHAPAMLASVLSLAGGQSPNPELGAPVRREQVLSYLRSHMSDPVLDADKIARGCHISRRTLFRLFEDVEGGIAAQLRRIRIDRAQALLRQFPSRPVKLIGEICGFAGEAQFHRVFRALTDTTPAAYRHCLSVDPPGGLV